MNNYLNLLRFLTDYERVNSTHFWSKVSNTWWSQCKRAELMNPDYSIYREILVVDGYKKLRNLSKSFYKTTCVCVGKVQRTIFIIDIRITIVWSLHNVRIHCPIIYSL